MKDFYIGTPYKYTLCSALCIQLENLLEFSISRNEHEYWIYFRHMTFKIERKCDEGKKIADLITDIIKDDSLDNNDLLAEYLFELVKQNSFTFDDFWTILETEKERSFENGKEFKINELKKVLDIKYYD